jgi:hypothetical protein
MSRDKIINVAAGELGTKESPPDSNCTNYGEWFGENGQKWCAIFVSWVFYHAGYPLGPIDTSKGFSSCQSGYNHWHQNGEIVTDPKPADIVLFDWNQNGHCDHTGIFFKWIKKGLSFYTYEGNTSVGNDSDGGEVMKRIRYMRSVKAFVSPEVLKQDVVGLDGNQFNQIWQ